MDAFAGAGAALSGDGSFDGFEGVGFAAAQYEVAYVGLSAVAVFGEMVAFTQGGW